MRTPGLSTRSVGKAILPFLPLIRHRTPVHPLPSLARRLNRERLWIKRDDLITFGFGGNKIRGLEFLVGEALAKGADTLITGAGPLSNHVRATAAVGAKCGLCTAVVYWGEDKGHESGNYELVRMLGAETRFTGSLDRSSVDDQMASLAEELTRSGRRPYVIPRGGASPLGVVGHVLAVQELLKQFTRRAVMPEVVVLPVGSGGTLAGWLLGTSYFNAPWRVEAVTVSRPAAEAKTQVLQLMRETERLLGIDSGVSESSVVIHDGYIGPGYGVPSAEGSSAIRLAAVEEGVFLDPVYTGKALAGLVALCDAGRFDDSKAVLFLHTGGQPGLFVPGQCAWT
ncbi:D-cysteine desulfhydrase family protein [Methylocaldum sp.]|uniref:1-aminocyclopropane-1-carboxylate deaminase/D-cysteine desulfhydrase n=1 Tax=Methylocaldum sp. TaxID=1969727 RepID=UPI002D7485EF|nr:D-cysteine desulfhydrase family protein [Methylocaldum sp.]HYE34319.1 D-cysteine desulfhydrase family protein [Methylocaldum sp.]